MVCCIGWIAWTHALSRRLRNLSHAINVELMRTGITRSLLPIQLLDAVISGQLPSQSAPSNLLKLTLPLTLLTEEQSMQTVCVLVRPSDLEFDDHSLRRIRSRLRLQRRGTRQLACERATLAASRACSRGPNPLVAQPAGDASLQVTPGLDRQALERFLVWIRPLQQALSLEADRGFADSKGRKEYSIVS